MNWITQVAKHHKEYIKTIENFGEYFYAEDLVQEMYIRLITKNKELQVIVNGQVNRYYIYLTLRSLFVDFYRQKSKVIKVDVSEILTLQQIDEIEEHEAFGDLMQKVNNELKTWHYYDQLLFKLYKDTDKSMRDISQDTNISLRSIFCTIKSCKERLKENVSEDYEDYINQDYELIK
jgi:RNA polymerase sigma factor (sigma-70 family)